MWQKFETRALRLDSPATASSLGILMMLAQSTSVAAQDPTVTTPPHQNPTLATLVVTGAEATEAQKAESS
jgi:iron complex outermembrane receptor protein